MPMPMIRRSKTIENAPQIRQEELKDLINRLEKEELNLLILKDGEIIYSSKEDGMAPLLEAIDQGLEKLIDSTVVDKIVGKAAALLIAYFKAEGVYTKLLSRSAIEVLKKYGISYAAERVVDYIRDKEDKDICPFEKMVLKIEDPQEGYKKLKSGL